MIFTELVTFLKEKKMQTKLRFSSVRTSPYRLSNKRYLRNRGLIINPF